MGHHAQPWFRWVPTDRHWQPVLDEHTGQPVDDDDVLTSLVLADPGTERTHHHLPDDAYSGAFAAWEIARGIALAAWQPLTDATNLMPEVPKALREGHFRHTPHSPATVTAQTGRPTPARRQFVRSPNRGSERAGATRAEGKPT
jgi:hypothetical protein